MPEIDLLARYPKGSRSAADLHRSTPARRAVAKRFDFDYFDGDRSTGYGGYHYDGRWYPVAEDIARHFDLKAGDRVLDIGCAKGFLMHELMRVVPGLVVLGLEISAYAIEHAMPSVRDRIVRWDLAQQLPWRNGQFEAVLAINVVHNLDPGRATGALREIQRISDGRAYVQVDAYRNQDEREAFLNWALTAETHGEPSQWLRMFEVAGYTGDYYWTILEV